MADRQSYEKPLTPNSTPVRRIAMKFDMMTHFDPLEPDDEQKIN